MKRDVAAAALTIVVCGLVVLGVPAELRAQDPPIYKVNPFWPKPLPNKWIMQQVPTLVVDKDDHIWVFNRSRQIRPDESGASTTPPRTDCCIAAPAVLEFDTEGNLLKAWGGPGYVPNWPREQTIATILSSFTASISRATDWSTSEIAATTGCRSLRNRGSS